MEGRIAGKMERMECKPSPDCFGTLTVVGFGRTPGQPGRGRMSARSGHGTVFAHIQVISDYRNILLYPYYGTFKSIKNQKNRTVKSRYSTKCLDRKYLIKKKKQCNLNAILLSASGI